MHTTKATLEPWFGVFPFHMDFLGLVPRDFLHAMSAYVSP